MYKPELLAPAGDLNRLKWALDYGADAVYIGGHNYSLRANANNFSLDEIKEGTEYAHKNGKKVYVTVNMIFHNEDLEGLDEYLINLDSIGIDGIILSDFAVLESIKKNNLKTPIVVSTQMSTTNYKGALFWEKLGASTVVLARETSKEDIKEIKEKTNLRVESFIHGAMCTSYSGRCVMSNYITLRDSNRGGCAQICRFSFNKNDNPEIFSIASKDLNMIDYISDMIDLKIDSFKIEGRMKSLYYIATVTDAYRNIIDKKMNNTLNEDDILYYRKVLNRCANRENAAQFYNGLPDENGQYYNGRTEVSNQDFLAIIEDYKDGYAYIEQRNIFKLGDDVEIFGPNTKVFSYTINEIINNKNEPMDRANHVQEKLKINCPFKVEKGDIMRVKIS